MDVIGKLNTYLISIFPASVEHAVNQSPLGQYTLLILVGGLSVGAAILLSQSLSTPTPTTPVSSTTTKGKNLKVSFGEKKKAGVPEKGGRAQ